MMGKALLGSALHRVTFALVAAPALLAAAVLAHNACGGCSSAARPASSAP